MWKGLDPLGYGSNEIREQKQRGQRGTRLIILWGSGVEGRREELQKLWVTLWVLESNPGPLEDQPGLLTAEPKQKGDWYGPSRQSERQTLSTQCLCIRPHLTTSKNGELTACSAGPLEGSG